MHLIYCITCKSKTVIPEDGSMIECQCGGIVAEIDPVKQEISYAGSNGLIIKMDSDRIIAIFEEAGYFIDGTTDVLYVDPTFQVKNEDGDIITEK